MTGGATGGATGGMPGGPAAELRPTVLLVEDNADNREIYATYLTYVGYAVLTAEDAEEGLALARARQPDLIVMDVGLPGMDGNAATRLLKADPALRHIPVVVLTAHVHHEDRERSLEAGCDHFLTKPLEPRELGAALRRILADGGDGRAGRSGTGSGGGAAHA
ncbi:response regulator [Roseisolibacter agri]|uniref:response regulator n=1 Tax=Roseisolibacter agri TaxID=2014610 RepID=UPI0024E13C98|nr:response regulator [Roseisolibacter agri]